MNIIETLEARISELEETNQKLASQNLVDLYQSLSEDYNKLQARVIQILEFIEAQAEELAKYKQLATTAIDDAVALRTQLEAQVREIAHWKAARESAMFAGEQMQAQLAAIQCEDELPTPDGFDSLRATSEDKTVYAAIAARAQAMVRSKMVPLTAEQISDAIYKADAQHNIEFMTADWPVVFTRVIESAHGITGEPK